jgi:hypothetical protein
VFRGFRRNYESEVMVQIENNLEKVWFELRNEEVDSNELTKSYE